MISSKRAGIKSICELFKISKSTIYKAGNIIFKKKLSLQNCKIEVY